MKSRRIGASVLLACALAIAASVFSFTAQAADLGLTLSTTPSGPAEPAMKMTIPATESKGVRAIFVQQADATTEKKVIVRTSPLLEGDEEVSGAEVCIVVSADDGGCSEERTIPSGTNELPLVVRVKGLDRFGTFTSTIYAVSGGQTQKLSDLTVSRTEKTGVLTLSDIDSATGTKWFPPASTTVTLEVTATNSGSRPLSLTSATVTGLTGLSREYDVSVLPVDPVTLLSEGAAPASPSGGDVSAPPTEDGDEEPSTDLAVTEVPPGRSVVLEVRLPGVDRAGEHSGTLTVAGAGVAPASKPFTFTVKESGLVAGLFILSGLVLSYWARRLVGTRRTELLRQRRARLLLDEVARFRREFGDLEPRERSVLNALARRVEAAFDDSLAVASDPAKAFDEVDQKLTLFPPFVRGRRLVKTISVEPLKSRFQKDLDAVATWLEEEVAPDSLKAEVEARKKLLQGLPAQVEEEVRKHFLEQITNFETLVEPEKDLAEIGLDVLPALAKAKTLAVTDLEGARAEFERARKVFARTAARKLAASVPDERPEWFGPSEWTSFRERRLADLEAVAQAPTATEAMKRYDEAARSYLVVAASKLVTKAEAERTTATDQGRKDKLKEASEKATQAVRHAGDGAFRKARESYAEAVTAYSPAPSTDGVQMSDGAGKAPSRAGDRTLGLLDTVGSPASAGAADDMRDRSLLGDISERAIVEELKKNEFRFAVFMFLVALVSGLKVLWDTDPTWGDFDSYAIAFLWGLGLHQAAGAVDLSTFRSKFEGSGAGAGG